MRYQYCVLILLWLPYNYHIPWTLLYATHALYSSVMRKLEGQVD